MAQINKVAEAFLDGFGSLAAIFEPAVRPGSTENLIQEYPESTPVELEPGRSSVGSGGSRLIWLSLAAIFSVAALVDLSMLPAASGILWWVARSVEVGAISLWTLFLREIVEAVVLDHKAVHRA